MTFHGTQTGYETLIFILLNDISNGRKMEEDGSSLGSGGNDSIDSDGRYSSNSVPNVYGSL